MSDNTVVATIEKKKAGRPKGVKNGEGKNPSTTTHPKVKITAINATSEGFIKVTFDNEIQAVWGGENGEAMASVGFLSASKAAEVGKFLGSLPVYENNAPEFCDALRPYGLTTAMLIELLPKLQEWVIEVHPVAVVA